jgi:hypothetical protein
MRKLSIAALAIAFALAGGSAFADDNSMSQFTGESYKAFHDAQASVSGPRVASPHLKAIPDNGMSQYDGDSYAAFDAWRKSWRDADVDRAEVKARIAAANHAVPARVTPHSRMPANAFRNDTAA